MTPLESTSRILLLPASLINKLPVALLKNTPLGLCNFAAVAHDPSPELPGLPVPTTVVIINEVKLMDRITWFPLSDTKMAAPPPVPQIYDGLRI